MKSYVDIIAFGSPNDPLNYSISYQMHPQKKCWMNLNECFWIIISLSRLMQIFNKNSKFIVFTWTTFWTSPQNRVNIFQFYISAFFPTALYFVINIFCCFVYILKLHLIMSLGAFHCRKLNNNDRLELKLLVAFVEEFLVSP